jgi:proteasome accessory factor A
MSKSKPDRDGCPPLFGLETEYAYVGKLNEGAGDEECTDDGHLFLRTAMSLLPHLPGERSDLFLANGSRLYIDCGGHPELATAECTNPWQAVRYCLAGDQIMRQVASRLDDGPSLLIEGWLSKCNVDYSGAKTTWGCHHSFLYRCGQADLFKQLIPHLASRIVYSGAGGWNPFNDGLQFTLSPRSLHLKTAISDDGTHDRGILNTRDESLSSDGNERLHLQCGDSLESQTAIFLTMGTTALIVALTHAGIESGADVALADPLAAMRSFAFDPTCRATAPTVLGDTLSAVAIQRHYLGVAQQYAGEPFMPRWTTLVCGLWQTILDRLDAGAPWSVSDTLDWAIKYALYDRMLRRTGKNAGGLVMESGRSPVGSRDQFLEADLRFAQVTGTGLFRLLDQAGVLHHRVSGVGDIVPAMSVPPAGSRAAVRGQLIQKLHGHAVDACAHWDWVRVRKGNRRADLSDPFCRKAVWTGASIGSRAGRIVRSPSGEHDFGPTAILHRPVFFGSYQLRLDLRGRLTIPTQWRTALESIPQITFVMVVKPDACLVLCPESCSRALLVERGATGSVTGNHDEVRPNATPSSATNMHVAQLDARGRLTIPPEFRHLADLGQEVMAVGCLLSFEVWPNDRWKAHETTFTANFAEAARRVGL